MPLITILNHPSNPGELSPAARDMGNPRPNLAAQLRDTAATADVLGVTQATVTVVFGGEQALRDDRTLVIVVSGLFDRSDRPKEVRDRLAKKLGKAAETWIGRGWRVEVMIQRFDTAVESFYTTPSTETGT